MAQRKEGAWVKQARKIRSLSRNKQEKAYVYCYQGTQDQTGICRYVQILFVQSSWSACALALLIQTHRRHGH
jgi:hypothetical protein